MTDRRPEPARRLAVATLIVLCAWLLPACGSDGSGDATLEHRAAAPASQRALNAASRKCAVAAVQPAGASAIVFASEPKTSW